MIGNPHLSERVQSLQEEVGQLTELLASVQQKVGEISDKEHNHVGSREQAKVIYVAGPYTADTYEQTLNNVTAALATGRLLFNKGHNPIVPHANYSYATNDEWKQVIRHCMALIHRCDAVYMMEGWETSVGATIERYVAYATGRTVYYDLKDVPDVPQRRVTYLVDPHVTHGLEEIEENAEPEGIVDPEEVADLLDYAQMQ